MLTHQFSGIPKQHAVKRDLPAYVTVLREAGRGEGIATNGKAAQAMRAVCTKHGIDTCVRTVEGKQWLIKK